ncbi:MAG: hypothetical protein FWC43_04210 [Planctomycetaceae bacterium]|nr:hypothetical protein [Planctomycetaceae bacterium]
MIAFKPNVRVVAIDRISASDTNQAIRLHFNTGYTHVAPKSFLDAAYTLDSSFTADSKVVDEFLSWGIIQELSDTEDQYTLSKGKLAKYTVHLPRVDNTGIMTAVLLQEMRVKVILYENRIVTQNDVEENIYFKSDDVGKDVISVIQDNNCDNPIQFSPFGFNSSDLNENSDIIVNSDKHNWINDERLITINTWNYKNAHFENFRLFNDRIDVSDDLKKLVDGYILAVRSIDDMLYSIMKGRFN